MDTPLLPVAARGRGRIPLKTAGWTENTTNHNNSVPQHHTDTAGPLDAMSRRSTMSMTRSTTGDQLAPPMGDYRDNKGDRDEPRERNFFRSMGGDASSAGGHNGSMERTKRPDQQYYQTKRPVSIERKPIYDDPPKRSGGGDDDHHQRRGGGGGGRTFVNSMGTRNQAPAVASQRQSESRDDSNNPFTRNLSRGGGSGRRDSTSSEVNQRPVLNGGGGGGRGHIAPGGGGGKGGNAGFWLPDNYNELPPRFQRKILQKHGLDPSILDKPRSNEIISEHLGKC